MTRAESDPRTVDPPWEQLVLICRKCSRKPDGGFGTSGENSLRSDVKRALRSVGQRRRYRVVEVGCLSICPKNAVSVIRPSRSRVVLVVPAGSDTALVAAMIAGDQ